MGRTGLYLDLLAAELPQYAAPLRVLEMGRHEMLCMPTRKHLEAVGRGDLIDLIVECGGEILVCFLSRLTRHHVFYNVGFCEVAVKLGMRSKRRPAGYWEDPENLDDEIRAFVASQWTQQQSGQHDKGCPKRYFYNMVSRRITSRLPGGKGARFHI